MSDQLDILRKTLADFSDIEQSGDEFAACFYTDRRVISYIEENKCIDKIKKAGGTDVKSMVRAVGICKFKFRVP